MLARVLCWRWVWSVYPAFVVAAIGRGRGRPAPHQAGRPGDDRGCRESHRVQALAFDKQSHEKARLPLLAVGLFSIRDADLSACREWARQKR